MKKSRFTEHQILQAVRELEVGISAMEVGRKLGVSNATVYNWRTKYGGMTKSELKRLRNLEHENHCLKRMYAELSMDHEILKAVVEKKL